MTQKNYWSEIKTMALNSLIHKSVRRPSINIIVCRTKKIPSPAQITENINNEPFLFRQTFQKLGKNERKTKKFAQNFLSRYGFMANLKKTTSYYAKFAEFVFGSIA